jgi:hypothetical protein
LLSSWRLWFRTLSHSRLESMCWCHPRTVNRNVAIFFLCSKRPGSRRTSKLAGVAWEQTPILRRIGAPLSALCWLIKHDVLHLLRHNTIHSLQKFLLFLYVDVIQKIHRNLLVLKFLTMNTDDERKENEYNRKANHSANSDFLNVNGDLLCSFEPNDLGNINGY